MSASDAVILLLANGFVAVGRVLRGLRRPSGAEVRAQAVVQADRLSEREAVIDSWEADEIWAAEKLADQGVPTELLDDKGRPPGYYTTLDSNTAFRCFGFPGLPEHGERFTAWDDGEVRIRKSDGRISATSVSNPNDCPEDARSLGLALLAAAAAYEAES